MSPLAVTRIITEKCMENSDSQLFRYLIAGPCAAESEEQVYETARQLHSVSAQLPYPVSFFRAGVWKPRSNSSDFCGAGKKALPWLQRVSRDFGFPICVEVAKPQHVVACLLHGIKCFWIGARTAVNPFAVQEIADAVQDADCTILVKNPAIPDLRLWLGDVERFEKVGVKQVFAVHRGFAEQRENVLRNAPMWEIPIAFKVARPDIPLICDPSHIAGDRRYIQEIAQIAIDYGYNGLMLETHCAPKCALSDAHQQLTIDELTKTLNSLIYKASTSNPDDLLRQQRTLISNIDAQISQLLAKRIATVEEIARIKHDNNIPLVQPDQWNSVVKNWEQYAPEDEDYLEFLHHILEELHHFSLKCQRKVGK